MEEKLFMTMDDTSNIPLDQVPVLDPETEAKAHADAEAIFSRSLKNSQISAA